MPRLYCARKELGILPTGWEINSVAQLDSRSGLQIDQNTKNCQVELLVFWPFCRFRLPISRRVSSASVRRLKLQTPSSVAANPGVDLKGCGVRQFLCPTLCLHSDSFPIELGTKGRDKCVSSEAVARQKVRKVGRGWEGGAKRLSLERGGEFGGGRGSSHFRAKPFGGKRGPGEKERRRTPTPLACSEVPWSYFRHPRGESRGCGGDKNLASLKANCDNSGRAVSFPVSTFVHLRRRF